LALNETLNGHGLNSIVSFDFSPISKPIKLFDNGSSFCPVKGERVDGRLVDTYCATDKLEICLRNGVLAMANDTEPCADCPFMSRFAGGSSQAQFVEFLACFEGVHHANLSALESCAKGKVAIEKALQTVHKDCYDEAESRELLWAAENTRPYRKNIKHFPTVLLNGQLWQNGDVPKATLASAICKLYNGPSSVCH